MKSDQKGITLIEGLVAIAVVSLVLMLFTVGLFGARKESRDVKRVSDMQALRSSMASLKVQFGSFKDAGCQTSQVSECLGGNLQQVMPSIVNFNDPSGRNLCIDDCSRPCDYSFSAELEDEAYQVTFYLEKGIGKLKPKGCYALTQDGFFKM